MQTFHDYCDHGYGRSAVLITLLPHFIMMVVATSFASSDRIAIASTSELSAAYFTAASASMLPSIPIGYNPGTKQK